VLKNTEELRAKRKKELKKDSASKIKSLVDEVRQSYGRLCGLQASRSFMTSWWCFSMEVHCENCLE